MMTQRWRPVLLSGVAVVAVWLVAIAGYSLARNARMTAEKVRQYAESTDLRQVSGEARARALKRLADLLNALSLDERRKAQLERVSWDWMDAMTEDEKAAFIDATMPTGFKQMLASFEQLPEEKRKHTVEDALRRLREAQVKMRVADGDSNPGTNVGPVLSDDLQKKIRKIGLQTFYSQSSAQTKAEMAPVLEELQRVMESGRPFNGR